MTPTPHISEKVWLDSAAESFFSDDARIYGRARKDADGWMSFDCTRQNASRSGNLVIGHFPTQKEAKRSIIDWWAEVR